MYKLFISILFITASNAAPANSNLIVKCFGDSPRFKDSYFELFTDNQNKLASAYTMGNAPLYYPIWTNADKIVTPPSKFVEWMEGINNYRDTGIDPRSVKFFQNVFIDGSNRYSVELWNLMDANKKTIGWVAHAYSEVIGCYEN